MSSHSITDATVMGLPQAITIYKRYFPQQVTFEEFIFPWCFGVCMTFPWVFVFALPPLRLGMWFNTEGVALGLASLGAISSFILLLISWNHIFHKNPAFSRKELEWKNIFHSLQRNALLVAICGLSVISVITLPFSNNIELSWFGHPEQMTGGWLWLSLSAILLCFVWLERHRDKTDHIRTVRSSTILACYVQIILVLFAHPKFANFSSDWVLYHFTAHLGMIGACLFLLSIRKNNEISLMPLLFGIFAILLSNNKIAMGGLLLAPLLYFAISKYNQRTNVYKLYLSSFLICMLILPFAEYISFYFDIFPTLSSRFISLKLLWLDFIGAPFKNTLVGMGWGQMSDSIIRQLSTAELTNPQIANWEGIGRYDASSLNQLADAFAAVGVVGAFFSALISLSPFLRAKKYFVDTQVSTKTEVTKYILYTSFVICVLLHNGWFMMLSTFPIFLSTIMVLDLNEDDGIH